MKLMEVKMDANITANRELLCSRKQQMDVLWGAWVKHVELDESQMSFSNNLILPIDNVKHYTMPGLTFC